MGPHFGTMLASRSRKKAEKESSRKTCVFGDGQNASPWATSVSKCAQDVRPRRPDGAIWKGKLKAETKKHNIRDQTFSQRAAHLTVETKTTYKPIF